MVSIAEYLSSPRLILRKLSWLMMYHGREREVTINSYNGRLTFDSRDRIIGRQLWLRRGFEEDWLESAVHFLRLERLLPPSGGRLLDVGANIGMICIALLQRHGFESATVFEPEPRNYELLRHNLQQNGVAEQVSALQLALSSVDADMELELSSYNSGDHRIRVAEKSGAFDELQRRTVRVPVRRLDDMALSNPAEFADVRLVWIDIQGHEGHFLKGASDFLRSGGPASAAIPMVSEFWPYGILRSGMSADEYVDAASNIYSHAWVLEGSRLREMEVGALRKLFDTMRAHTDMRQIIMARR